MKRVSTRVYFLVLSLLLGACSGESKIESLSFGNGAEGGNGEGASTPTPTITAAPTATPIVTNAPAPTNLPNASPTPIVVVATPVSTPIAVVTPIPVTPNPSVTPIVIATPTPVVTPVTTATPIATPEPTSVPTPQGSIELRLVEKVDPGVSPLESGTASVIAVLQEGVTANLYDHQFVGIEAIPQNISDVASVTLALSGMVSLSRTEQAAGYFINGDSGYFQLANNELPSGNYTLAVSVNDSNAQTMLSRTVNFSVMESATTNTPPVAEISINGASSGEAPFIVEFNGGGSTDDVGILSYTWSFGDGSANQSGVNVSHIYTEEGTYNATLTVSDAQGANDVGSVTITVTSPSFDAAGLFASNCAICHDSDASGNAIGPAIAGESYTRTNLESIIARMPTQDADACDGNSTCISSMADYIFANFATEQAGPDTSLSCEAQDGLFSPKVRRLTGEQFQNTINDIFVASFDAVSWPDFGDSIPTIGMSNNADSLRINTININEVYDSVDQIVDIVIASDPTVSSCASSGSDACVDNVLTQYSQLLWRRPATSEELNDVRASLTRLTQSSVTNAQQLELVFKSLMLSANFLFRNELGVVGSDVNVLNAYEIASIMSYALWDSSPDATLYALAASGDLENADVIEQQVQRMMQDDRFGAVLVKFYKDYLKLDRVLTVDKVAELNFSSQIRESLLRSVELSLGSGVSNTSNAITDALSSDSFFVNDATASLFGLNPTNFSSSLQETAVSADERNGILTHPAFLAVHSKEGASGIVKRGVFVLEQLLCRDLGDPPDELTEADLPEDIDPEVTSTRDLLYLQHSSQPVCAGCHTTIDPAGYGFEHYDALGQFRMFEKDIVPIDASGSLAMGSDTITYQNGVEYTEALMQSDELAACVNRRFLEYIVGQSVTENSCEYAQLQEHIDANGNSIASVITGLMQLESIRLRGN